MAKPCALIVEDDAELRAVLTLVLGDDYAIVGAATVTQALTAVGAAWPDVVLLDLSLPGQSGVAFLEGCQDQYGRVPPTVIVSAYVQPGATADLTAAARALAPRARIVSKPFAIEDLQEAVAAVREVSQ